MSASPPIPEAVEGYQSHGRLGGLSAFQACGKVGNFQFDTSPIETAPDLDQIVFTVDRAFDDRVNLMARQFAVRAFHQRGDERQHDIEISRMRFSASDSV